jgi:hypothetical protein
MKTRSNSADEPDGILGRMREFTGRVDEPELILPMNPSRRADEPELILPMNPTVFWAK